MKSFLLISSLLLTQVAAADMIGYGYRGCVANGERRGDVSGKDVCMLDVTCEKFQLRDPKTFIKVKKTAYCAPDDQGRCPTDGQACLDDKNITDKDIPRIKSASGRPQGDCGEESLAKKKSAGGDDSDTPKGTATITPLNPPAPADAAAKRGAR